MASPTVKWVVETTPGGSMPFFTQASLDDETLARRTLATFRAKSQNDRKHRLVKVTTTRKVVDE